MKGCIYCVGEGIAMSEQSKSAGCLQAIGMAVVSIFVLFVLGAFLIHITDEPSNSVPSPPIPSSHSDSVTIDPLHDVTGGSNGPGLTCEQMNKIIKDIEGSRAGTVDQPCYIHHDRLYPDR